MKHIFFIFISLFLIIGIPAVFFGDWSSVFSNGGVDAVSGASLDVPDSPSGDFYIFMNRARHHELAEWRDFFEERPVGVIFEDLSCRVLAADVTGVQLAERYQARLAENQMKLRPESNRLLFAAKTENGYFDVVIVSKEISDACGLEKVFSDKDIMVISVMSEEVPAACSG